MRRHGAADAAKQLADSLELQFDYLAGASPAMLYTARSRAPFDFAFVSKNAVRLFGFPGDTLCVEGARQEWIHPADRASAEAGFSRALDAGRHAQEYRVSTVDGAYRWVRDECRAPDDEDTPELLVGRIVDVTERRVTSAAFEGLIGSMEKRVGDAVRDVGERADRLQTILDGVLDAVLVIDSGGDVVEANGACAAVFGLAPAELRGGPIGRLFCDTPFVPPGPRTVEERRGTAANGEEVLFEVSCGRTIGPFGHPVDVLVVREVRRGDSSAPEEGAGSGRQEVAAPG